MKAILRKTILLLIAFTLLVPAVHADDGKNATDYLNPHFIICIDTSGSMAYLSNEITNMVETYFYIANCSYIKPETYISYFSNSYAVIDGKDPAEIIKAVSELEYLLNTNIELSLNEINKYLCSHYDIDMNKDELTASEIKKLSNTTLIYISDGEATLGNTESAEIIGTPCINHINIYQAKFNSGGVSMVNMLEDSSLGQYYPSNDTYLLGFIQFIVDKLGGQIGYYTTVKPGAKDGLYSLMFYIINKKPANVDKDIYRNDSSFVDSIVLWGSENEFSDITVNFESYHLLYKSQVVSLQETIEEELNYLDNGTDYSTFGFEFAKPEIRLSGKTMFFRNDSESFSIKEDSSLDESVFNNITSIIYEIRSENGEIVMSEVKYSRGEELVFSTDTPGDYKISLNLFYTDNSFGEGNSISREIEMKDCFKFTVLNRSPISSDQTIGNYEKINLIAGDAAIRDLTQYFQDADGDSLTYAILSDNTIDVKLDAAGTITIKTESAVNEEIVVQASDNYGGNERISFYVVAAAEEEKSFPVWLKILLPTLGGLLIAAIIITFFLKNRNMKTA